MTLFYRGNARLTQTEDTSIMKYCGYWHSLRGEPPIQNDRKTIHLSRTNVFNRQNLKNLMNQIALYGGL